MDRPYALYFNNDNTGFAVGSDLNFEGEIKKTTDGGISWTLLQHDRTATFGDIWVFNVSNLLIVGGSGGIFGGRPKILRSTDSGISWYEIYCNATVPFYRVCFINDKTGYLIGSAFLSSVFLKSTDGGYGWNDLPLDTNLDLWDVNFIDENNGIVVGNSIIYKTTNGGETLMRYINRDYYLHSVDYADDSTAYAAGLLNNGSGNFVILKTDNAGNNWYINYYNPGGDLYCIRFVNKNFGVAVGYGGNVVKTTNGGVSWERLSLSDNAELLDVNFININTGWIIGNKYPNGYLYKTTNAGVNWARMNSLTETPTEFSILQNYPNPFNPKTNIRYKLENQSMVVLKVYDIAGREVITLVNKEHETGVYEVEFDGSNLSSGIYFYNINVKTLNSIIIKRYNETKRMVLLK